MVRLPQDEQKQEGTTTPCARGPAGEGGIPRDHLVEAGSREEEAAQWDLKFQRRFSHYFQKTTEDFLSG